MPNWLDVDLMQTVLLVAGTGIAYLTWRGGRDDRKDAVIERRLEHVAERVAELGQALTIDEHVGGKRHEVYIAKRNLQSALATAHWPLVKTRALLDVPIQEIRPPEVIDDALREIRAELERLTE